MTIELTSPANQNGAPAVLSTDDFVAIRAQAPNVKNSKPKISWNTPKPVMNI